MCLLGAFFLLMLLSALVEATAPEEAGDIPGAEAAPYHAELLPYTVPMAEHSAVTPVPHSRLPGAVIMPGIPQALPACSRGCDANGRWVRGKCYVYSVYQVFRQDVAGG